jgi:beta-lactamase class A
MTALVLLAMAVSLYGNQEKEWEFLRLDLIRLFGSTEGVFALAMEDLSTGKRVLINEREMFHAASTMKTPVMIELYLQAGKGRFNLDDSIIVKNQFSSIVDGSSYSLSPDDDSDLELYERIGTKMTMRDLILRMITRSSNLATNLLIEFANAESVTSTMRDLGADSIQVLRGVEDQKAYDRGMNNRTSALDLLVIFKSLAEGDIVDNRGRREMMNILEAQEFHDMIPALLPSGTRVAHKTGSITGVQHDSGIVFLPDGRQYVLVVLSKELKDKEEGKKVIAEASKAIYDVMTKGR